jgi:prepilin-type N-terminal cleavage/methylation domain-containing protein
MKNKSGFTVVEVLVVIGIIAVLTVIVFPAINNIRAKNRDAERIADISAIQLGLSLYYNQHTSEGYPVNLDTLLNAKYITSDSMNTPDGQPYIYVPLKNPSGSGTKCTYYHLGTVLELPSAQLDSANNTFTSKAGETISNGYEYCGGYTTPGIDPTIERMYSVRP